MLVQLETLPISEWIAYSSWGYPLLLSAHSVGMAVVVGIMVMLDLRVLGVARTLPISTFERLVPIAWAGFVVNLISGVLLFMSLASRIITNWPFLSKLGAIVIAAFISWLLWRSLRRDIDAQADDGVTSAGAGAGVVSPARFSSQTRMLAISSLAAWAAAILFGRLIAYVLDAAMLAGDF